jgi:hypothetical protein
MSTPTKTSFSWTKTIKNNYDYKTFRLTEISTCSSLASITGANRPASGLCPLDSAPTACPRMIYEAYH